MAEKVDPDPELALGNNGALLSLFVEQRANNVPKSDFGPKFCQKTLCEVEIRKDEVDKEWHEEVFDDQSLLLVPKSCKYGIKD